MECVIDTSGDHGHQRVNEELRVITLVERLSLGGMFSPCSSMLPLDFSPPLLCPVLLGWAQPLVS